MRIGMAGLNALYWPITSANYLLNKPGVDFLAAATLGEDPAVIKDSLGMTPDEYIARYNLHLYNSAEEMIAGEALDTLILISPHSQHADWVERLAPLGVKTIYIPKTFTTSAEEARRIVAAEKTHAIRVGVGPSARFLPQLAAVKQALDADRIGEPFALRICHHHGTIDVFHPKDWYRTPTEGGPELSLAWYGIDLALHYMNDRVTSIFARYGNYTSPDSPFMDCGRIEMGLARGGLAAFDMYFCNRVAYPSWQLEIVGPKGVISIHRVEEGSQTAVTLDSKAGSERLPLPEKAAHWEMFWVGELLEDRPLSLSAEYASEVTRLSLAARESARANQVITV